MYIDPRLEEEQDMDDEMEPVTVTGVARLEGTLVVLYGLDEQGREVMFACEPRMAQDIIDALDVAEDDVVAGVPSWAFLSRA